MAGAAPQSAEHRAGAVDAAGSGIDPLRERTDRPSGWRGTTIGAASVLQPCAEVTREIVNNQRASMADAVVRRRSRIVIRCRARLSLSLSEWGAASILV